MPVTDHRRGWKGPLSREEYLDILFPGKEIRDTLRYRVGNPTGTAIQTTFENLRFILFYYREIQIALAGRTAEDGKQ